MVRVLALIIILTTFFSCATGPQAEKKSPLNYLSGDHYSADVASGVLPIHIRRKKKNTNLSGNCFFKLKQDDFKYPVKFQKIILLKNGREMTSATTKADGSFEVSAYLENGEYELILDSAKYKGRKLVEISKYDYNNILFEVDKK